MLRRRCAAAAIGVVLITGCATDSSNVAIERAPGATVPSAAGAPAAAPTPTPTGDADPTDGAVPTASGVDEATTSLAAATPAATAAELAARITKAEAVARDPSRPTAEVAAAAFELQQLYRQLGRTPDWDAAVLADVPPSLQLTVTNNVAARREFRGLFSRLSDTLPAWRIIDPEPPETLLAHYREGQKTFGVPWEILAAVNLVETGMGRIRGTSVAGAQGPMQFIPSTWDAFGEGDINDPHDAILAAARYLAHNGGGRGEIDNALFRYNNSNRYVRGVKAYAAIMAEDPDAFAGFYHWQIVYLSQAGDIWLPVGYEQLERTPVLDYLAANPSHYLGTATN